MYVLSMEKFINNIFKNIDSNIIFDENQKNIIKYNKGNLIVIAGAGAGKTTTMSAKIYFLVKYLCVDQNKILVISFTNKAVDELSDYINNKMKLNVEIFTFHKLAKKILEEEGFRLNIIEDNEKVVKEIIKDNKNVEKVIRFLWKNNKIGNKFTNNISKIDVLTKYTVENLNLLKTTGVDIKNYCGKDLYVSFLYEIEKKLSDYKFKNNLFDFDDLILKATEISNEKNFCYDYIIIDEYQDISKLRFEFIKKIKKGKIITVVGDDWQAIYSFAGSDVNLFLDFSKEFNAKKMIIEKTYRNSQELIDIAGAFVMKDKNLIKKNLKSQKKIINPIKCTSSNNIEEVIKYLIKKYGENKNILLLGRFKKDVNILNNNFKIKGEVISYNYNRKIKITFLTIHSSKGLGYDNVIILNNDNKEYGFPSKKKVDYFKKKYLFNKNNLLEERRLFYVALTRTKNEVILLHSKRKSKFIKELKNEVKSLKI